MVVPGDTAQLSETLHSWERQPNVLRRMSERACDRAKLYHRDRILPEYEIELQKLVQEKHKGTGP